MVKIQLQHENDERLYIKEGHAMRFSDASIATRNELTAKAISEGMARVMSAVSGSEGKARAAEAYAHAIAAAIKEKP